MAAQQQMVTSAAELRELRSGTLLAPGGGGVVLGQEQATYFNGCVRLLMSRWAALRLAVDHQWGGQDSVAKADAAVDDVTSRFVNAKGCVHADEVEDYLDDLMLEQFSTEIEDGSTRIVAEDLLHIFQLIAKGDKEQADAWMARMGSVKLAQATREPGQDDNDDDDDGAGPSVNGDDEDEDDDEEEMEMDEAEAEAERARREEERVRREEMEADGFTMITSKRGGRGRKS